MDIIFDCPKCKQELAVDSSGIGEEIDCPQCGSKIVIPGDAAASSGAGASPEPASVDAPSEQGQWAVKGASPIASSAAAKVVLKLSVPVHDKPQEKLIEKAAVPLEVAAKTGDRQIKVKTIRHVDCVEVGHDRFDEMVTSFLNKVGEQYIVSITNISYSHIDIGSQRLIDDYGVLIIYKG